jgi:hypothetical protein
MFNIGLTRFQQSLVFERGVSNRTTQQVRAIREWLSRLAGVLNRAGNPVTPQDWTHAAEPDGSCVTSIAVVPGMRNCTRDEGRSFEAGAASQSSRAFERPGRRGQKVVA